MYDDIMTNETRISIARKMFREEFSNDPDMKRGYKDNIAMFINDFCDITDYEKRNKLADELIKLIFY